jgi:hypothetical protein
VPKGFAGVQFLSREFTDVVVFPDYTLSMMYNKLDTGNFFVIPGSLIDVWVAERFSALHGKRLTFVNLDACMVSHLVTIKVHGDLKHSRNHRVLNFSKHEFKKKIVNGSVRVVLMKEFGPVYKCLLALLVGVTQIEIVNLRQLQVERCERILTTCNPNTKHYVSQTNSPQKLTRVNKLYFFMICHSRKAL